MSNRSAGGITLGPWLTTVSVVASGVVEVSVAVVERSRQTTVGRSVVVSASDSMTSVARPGTAPSAAGTGSRVQVTVPGVTVSAPGPAAETKEVPSGAVTVTVAPGTGADVGLVTMIREG